MTVYIALEENSERIERQCVIVYATAAGEQSRDRNRCGATSCARSARVRFGSVSSLANADWPRQLAGASNDTQRRRAAPPSSRLHAAPPPYGIFSRQQRTAAPSASRANASPSIPRAPHFSPRYPFETAHVPRRPVLRLLFLPVLRVSFDSIFPLSSSPIPLSLSFSALSSISPRACLLLLACSLSFFLGRPRLAQYMLYF